MTQDPLPVIVSVDRSLASFRWTGNTPEFTANEGIESRSGMCMVPGVGIVSVKESRCWDSVSVRHVFVSLVHGRYTASAAVVGHFDTCEESESKDLIVLAARAALKEAKRKNRRKRKPAAKSD